MATKRHIEHMNKDSAKVILASKITVSSQDLEQLEMLDKELHARFKDQLDLIKRRSTKWGKTAER